MVACRGKKITFLTLIAALGNPSLSLSSYSSSTAHILLIYIGSI
jgi:hypothetical protein